MLAQLEAIGCEDIPVYMGTDEPLEGFWDIDELLGQIGTIGYTAAYRYVGSQYTDDYLTAHEMGITTANNLPVPTTKPQEQPSVDFLIDQVHEHPGQVTIIALGGLTNIAQAIERDPTFASDAAGIVYMGGVFTVHGEELQNMEINWWYDPKATDICLHGDWKRQLVVPHDVATRCTKGKDVYDRYASNNTNAFTKLLVDSLRDIYEQGGEESLIYCWDPIAAAAFLQPELVTDLQTMDIAVEYDRESIAYGSCFCWKEGMGPKRSVSCDVVLDVDRGAFWDFVSDIFAVTGDVAGD